MPSCRESEDTTSPSSCRTPRSWRRCATTSCIRSSANSNRSRRSIVRRFCRSSSINDGGFRRLAVTKEDFERLLAPWKRALGDLMLAMPRNEGESLSDYRLRLTQSDGDGRWWNRLYGMANMLAHIHRIEEEERAERQRELEEEAQRKREEKERRRESVKPRAGAPGDGRSARGQASARCHRRSERHRSSAGPARQGERGAHGATRHLQRGARGMRLSRQACARARSARLAERTRVVEPFVDRQPLSRRAEGPAGGSSTRAMELTHGEVKLK